eukprot:3956290-Pyramimonas_sp.AAC.1
MTRRRKGGRHCRPNPPHSDFRLTNIGNWTVENRIKKCSTKRFGTRAYRVGSSLRQCCAASKRFR